MHGASGRAAGVLQVAVAGNEAPREGAVTKPPPPLLWFLKQPSTSPPAPRYRPFASPLRGAARRGGSFFRWAIDKGRLEASPLESLKPPKARSVERRAYALDLIDSLRDAQPTLRDQIAIQLLGRLALRKNELRLLKVRDFDLTRGTVRVHGKGGKVVVLPLGFATLKRDLEVYLVGRGENEYLLYPKAATSRPMTSAGLHLWFKRCLKLAGLPDSVKMHELRHSAADNLWRQTGNMTLAQQLLRHESPAMTAGYLHPRREDLAAALASLEQVVSSGRAKVLRQAGSRGPT